MTTRSRRQTRRRTFGWYTSDPVAHNRTVAIAKARRAHQAVFNHFLNLSTDWWKAAEDRERIRRTSEIIDDVATLGMTADEAREAINDHRTHHPNTTWDRTATIIHNLALHNALTDRKIDQ